MSDASDAVARRSEGDHVGVSTWLAMAAMGLAVFAIANDFTAMNVALPAIEGDLNTDLSTVQWVVNGYALVFGMLIVPGGRLADIFGRTRILYVGAALFAVFSLMGALAPNIGLLITARLLMGVGGALMWPAILGLIYGLLPSSKAGLAGGLVIGVAGIGNASGPIIAGALTEVSWRWIFVLNVPIAAIAIFATWRFVHVANPTEREKVDYLGTVLLSVSLFALLGALTVAPTDGWTEPLVIGGLALSAVTMAAFVLRERAAGEGALIPGSVMGNRPFLWACMAVLAMSPTFFTVLLYLPQFFQKIMGEDPLLAGLMLFPFVGVFAAASFTETWLLNRIGMKAVVTIGAACIFGGPLLFALLLDKTSAFLTFVPGMLVLGVGVGLFYSSVTTAALTALPESRSSLAGGLVYMFQIAGGAVGLGIATAVFLFTSNAEIDGDAQDLGLTLSQSEVNAVQGVLAGTESSQQVLTSYPSQADALLEVVRDAFVTGIFWAFLLCAVLALVGTLIAAFAVAGPISRFGRDVEREGDTSPEPSLSLTSDEAKAGDVAHRFLTLHRHRHRHTP